MTQMRDDTLGKEILAKYFKCRMNGTLVAVWLTLTTREHLRK